MARNKNKKQGMSNAERESVLAQIKVKNQAINDRDQKIAKMKNEITLLNRRLHALNAVVTNNGLSAAREEIHNLKCKLKRLEQRANAKDEYNTLLRNVIKHCNRCISLRQYLLAEQNKKVFHIHEPSTSSTTDQK